MPLSDKSSAPPAHRANYANADKLGAEITELCGYLYAATNRLLVLIRRFDKQGGWELAGLHSCARWLNFAHLENGPHVSADACIPLPQVS